MKDVGGSGEQLAGHVVTYRELRPEGQGDILELKRGIIWALASNTGIAYSVLDAGAAAVESDIKMLPSSDPDTETASVYFRSRQKRCRRKLKCHVIADP